MQSSKLVPPFHPHPAPAIRARARRSHPSRASGASSCSDGSSPVIPRKLHAKSTLHLYLQKCNLLRGEEEWHHRGVWAGVTGPSLPLQRRKGALIYWARRSKREISLLFVFEEAKLDHWLSARRHPWRPRWCHSFIHLSVNTFLRYNAMWICGAVFRGISGLLHPSREDAPHAAGTGWFVGPRAMAGVRVKRGGPAWRMQF